MRHERVTSASATISSPDPMKLPRSLSDLWSSSAAANAAHCASNYRGDDLQGSCSNHARLLLHILRLCAHVQ